MFSGESICPCDTLTKAADRQICFGLMWSPLWGQQCKIKYKSEDHNQKLVCSLLKINAGEKNILWCYWALHQWHFRDQLEFDITSSSRGDSLDCQTPACNQLPTTSDFAGESFSSTACPLVLKNLQDLRFAALWAVITTTFCPWGLLVAPHLQWILVLLIN